VPLTTARWPPFPVENVTAANAYCMRKHAKAVKTFPHVRERRHHAWSCALDKVSHKQQRRKPVRTCATMMRIYLEILRQAVLVALLAWSCTAGVAAAQGQSLFTTQAPASPNGSDGVAYELGLKFQAARSGQITAIRYWKASTEGGTHVGRIWSASGVLLAQATFGGESASGWQQQALGTPLGVQANTTYVVSVNTNSYFAITGGGLTNPIVNGDLRSVADGNNGVYGSPGNFPTSSYQNSNYFRDIVFVAGAPVPGAPAKLALAPASASTQTGVAQPYNATIQDANGNTVTSATNPVSFAVTGVSGSFSPPSPVTPGNGVATTSFTPGTAGSATVTASATGLTPASGALSVSQSTGTTGQSLFTTQTPASPDATDGVAYELGLKFRATRDGEITAIRYWKAPSESGPHVGRIWSATGALLAQTTFAGESASGWQEQALATPLTVQANTTYVVSVNANGYFSLTGGGLTTAVVSGDLSSVADGSNGVYGNPASFPAFSYHNANYFRDIVFVAGTSPPTQSLSKVSGDNQNGAAGGTLPNPLVVAVRDPNNNPIPDVAVTFEVTTGTGSVTPATATTNASGQASAVLTLGASGRVAVTASTANAGSVAFQAFVQNPVYLENQKPGTTAWRISNIVTESSPEISGYATATSVKRGGSLPLKVSLSAPGSYSIDVYRLGYYAGLGGRLMSSYGPLSGTTQPPCNVIDRTTLLIECEWTTSFTLQTDADWTSGLYVANLTHQASGRQSQIWFVVRDDSRKADLLFQSSFNTFLAYNAYGDAERYSLYGYNSTNGQAALKASYDRPFAAVTVQQNIYANPNRLTFYERNVARWLESQGYDVTYATNMDVHGNPALLRQNRAFLSVGHDEYWSLEMRDNVEQARDGPVPVNLAFFSANTAYWRVRFEPSPTTQQADRVMACYKDPAAADPVAPTYLWRGPENNRPENALLGVMYVGDNSGNYDAVYTGFNFTVTNPADPYFANMGVSAGTSLGQLVGYEWDAVVDNGSSPPGLVVLSQSPTQPTGVAPQLPAGHSGAVSNAVRYTAGSGARVFAAGSIQFGWGLDSDDIVSPRADPRVKQFVINVLSSMGARPLTPDPAMAVP
jgi:hypothetical protein